MTLNGFNSSAAVDCANEAIFEMRYARGAKTESSKKFHVTRARTWWKFAILWQNSDTATYMSLVERSRKSRRMAEG